MTSSPSPIWPLPAKPGGGRLAPRALALALALSFAPAPAPAGAQEDELSAMQKQIDELNKDAVGKAMETLAKEGVATDGAPIDPEAVRRVLAKRTGKKKGLAGADLGSPAYWFFMIFISIVGMGFFASGKRNGDIPFTLSGLIMMVYPYFVGDTLTLAGVGILLVVAPFLMRGR